MATGEDLTRMERVVCARMMYAATGAKDVALELNIALSTVNEHLANARRKTGHKTTLAMLLWMQRINLLEVEIRSVSNSHEPTPQISNGIDIAQSNTIET